MPIDGPFIEDAYVSNERFIATFDSREGLMPFSAPETASISKTGLTGHTSLASRTRPSRSTAPDDPRWQLVLRIAESRSLGKSARLADFLRYVCDRQIRGRDAEITEQQIGVKIFGRSEGYNSSDDNIVRNYARILRKRLDDYFRKEGREEPLILSIPRGHYIPVFSPREQAVFMAQPEFADAHDETPLPPKSNNDVAVDEPISLPLIAISVVPIPARRLWQLAAGATVLVVFAAFCGYLTSQTRVPWQPFQSHAVRSSHQFWSTLFDQHRDTFVVPADGGLVMMQSFTRSKVDLPDYVSGNYRSANDIAGSMDGFVAVTTQDQSRLTDKVTVLASRRYTSMVDLNISSYISQLREIVPERLVIRFARDLHIDDLRAANAILIGSNDANPWVSLFEPQLNFQFSHGADYGGSGTIINSHPLSNEPGLFRSVTGDPANRTYGVIAYIPNLDDTGHILLVEGINMAGTQAAGNFLFSPEQMQPMLDRALDAHGNLQPFEILLETTSIGAAASRSRVVSERVHSLTRSKTP